MSGAFESPDRVDQLAGPAIPDELLARPQWVAWWSVVGEDCRVLLPGGRMTGLLKRQPKPHKLPIDPHTGCLAATTRRQTWSSIEDARGAAQMWSLTGIGFVFDVKDPYVGIDLDNCREPQTGIIADWAWKIIRVLNSYTDISPSGAGVHIIIRGCLPKGKGRRKSVPGGEIEMYSQGRYFTFTGNLVDGAPVEIQDRSSELLAVHEKLFGDKKALDTTTAAPTAPPRSFNDDELIARAKEAKNGADFRKLWDGSWQGDYPSQSEADLALCNHLAFWTRNDKAQMDALFRQSGLMRQKWNREDYREGVLERSIAGRNEVWRGPSEKASSRDGQTKSAKQDGWAPPVLFGQPTLPPFPVDALPEPFRSFVSAEAVATQTPVDLAAMLILSAISVACARKVVLEVRPGYREPVNIYTVTALPSGNRKTAVFSAVTAPISDYEDAEARRSAGAVAKANTARKIKESKLRRLQEAAAGTGKDSASFETEAQELAAEIATSELPESPSVITDDCTPEKLASLLAKNAGRIAVMSPEGDVFDLMGGRYSNNRTPNFAVLLKGHAGDTIRVNRVGRAPEHVKNPAITVGLAVQPEVIRGLASRPEFRGRGLLARFFYSLPPSPLGRRTIGAPPVPENVGAEYHTQLQALLHLRPAEDEHGDRVPYVLQLSSGASEILTEFERWIEPQLGEFGILGSISDWGGKLVGGVARIAALLHMAGRDCNGQPWNIPVSQSTVAMAIQIGRYLIPHARAAFAEMGADPVVEKAKKILRRIEHQDCDSFTRRDIHQAMRSTFKRVEEADAPLKVLTDHGFIRSVSVGGNIRGRHASPSYEVNPLWKRLRNPRQDEAGNSEYFEYSEMPYGKGPGNRKL